MSNLQNTEVTIETVFSIETEAKNGNSFQLDDYSTMNEFHIDLAGWFDMEIDPEYIYLEWYGIPDCLINKYWLSPNFFELREALKTVDESLIEIFWEWCKSYGWNPGIDEPSQLVTDFLYAMSSIPLASDDEQEDIDEEDPYPMYFNIRGLETEIFDDNYN